MTPEALAGALVRAAYRKQKHPDIPFIAQAAGLPADTVSDIAALERPLIPDRPADPTSTLPDVTVPPGDGGPVRHYATVIHHLHSSDGHLLVYIACICGALLRARVAELPRHWVRHTEGLL